MLNVYFFICIDLTQTSHLVDKWLFLMLRPDDDEISSRKLSSGLHEPDCKLRYTLFTFKNLKLKRPISVFGALKIVETVRKEGVLLENFAHQLGLPLRTVEQFRCLSSSILSHITQLNEWSSCICFVGRAADVDNRSRIRTSRYKSDEIVKEGESKSTDEIVNEGESKSTDEIVKEGESKSTDEIVKEGESKSTDEIVKEGESKCTDEIVKEGETKSTDEIVKEGESKSTAAMAVASTEDTTSTSLLEDNIGSDCGKNKKSPQKDVSVKVRSFCPHWSIIIIIRNPLSVGYWVAVFAIRHEESYIADCYAF
jgi:hypothetical protein